MKFRHRCLLIETKDKRRFFTHEKNFVQLIEFSKAFNAEISVVKMEDGPVLELEELAPAICDPAYKKPKVQYEVIEKKMAGSEGRTRQEILNTANKVKTYIQGKFESGKVVSLDDLKKKFKRYNLTNAALCNHVRRVKQELEDKGVRLTKIGAGQYKAL